MKNSNYDIEKVFKELDIHCRINGRYGFTIPYLVKISANSKDNLSINNFLLEISNDRNKYFITLCEDLDEIIIGLHKPKEYAPLHMYPNFGSIHYNENKIGSFKNFELLSNHLDKKYSPIIKQGTFSKNEDTLCWE